MFGSLVRVPYKFRKYARGLYFQRPFLRALFVEGPMQVTKSIGLACSYKAKKKSCVTVPFLLCFTLHLRAISKYKPQEERFNGRCFAFQIAGGRGGGKLIHGGAYFRNFTVVILSDRGQPPPSQGLRSVHAVVPFHGACLIKSTVVKPRRLGFCNNLSPSDILWYATEQQGDTPATKKQKSKENMQWQVKNK